MPSINYFITIMGTHFHQDVFYWPLPMDMICFFFIRILISVLFFISLTAAVIEISYALSRPPGFNGHLVRRAELFHWKKDPFSSLITSTSQNVNILDRDRPMYLLCPPSPPLCRQASRLLLLPRAEGQGLDNEHNRQTYHLDDHQFYHCNHIREAFKNYLAPPFL